MKRAHEAQPALAAIRFAIEPRIGEGGKTRRDSDHDRDGGSGALGVNDAARVAYADAAVNKLSTRLS